MNGWMVRCALAATAAAALLHGQSTIHLPSQGRQADFSGYPWTKPARTVGVLPASCSAGEVVAVTGAGAGVYLCDAQGGWVAAAPHGHNLNELSGVTGKQGTGGALQAFGGGAVGAGDCAEFDASGNLVSAHAPCGSGSSNYSQNFTALTSVDLNHNLGTLNVLVGCVDSAEQSVTPDSIRVMDTSRVTVNFAVAQTGRCIVNASGGGGGGGGAVASVFGRAGAVAAQAGDYSFGQISGQLALSQIAPSALQGNGTRIQLFTGSVAADDCAKFDESGNLVSAGAACGFGAGDVLGAAVSVDGEVALFSGTTGKSLKRASANGVARLANGVLGTVMGAAADCVKVDGSAGPCGGSVYFGAGLAGVGTQADPVRIDPSGGVASQAVYSVSASPGTISANSCVEFNVTANGAAAGDSIAAAWPVTLPNGVIGMMYGGTNLVVVRLCNATATGISVPGGLTYGARVIRGF